MLHAGWGVSRTYTPGQINAAIKRARLDQGRSYIAYAVFLPPETLGATPSLLAGRTRLELIAAFERYRPLSTLLQRSEFYESGIGANSVEP